ncbi:MAG TPA: DUF3298 domain-containing protein [Arachidicoccus sp.]|nr:DUF3298 domain-containing protein [Arachidicoccus sp.]
MSFRLARTAIIICLIAPIIFPLIIFGQSRASSSIVKALQPQIGFYKRLEGSIGGKKVVMHLQAVPGNKQVYAGLYYYSASGQWLHLVLDQSTFKGLHSKSEGKTADTLKFTEINYSQHASAKDESPVLILVQMKGGYNGSWKQGEKAYKVTLQENYEEGALKLSGVAFSDSIRAYENNIRSPKAIMELIFPVASTNSNDTKSIYLSQVIKQMLTSNKADTTVELKTLVEQEISQYLQSYKTSMSEELGQTENPATFNYFSTINIQVVYNHHDYVILYGSNYEYSGGAHGNFGANLTCLDLANKVRMRLQDIVSIDSLKLQSIIEKYFRQEYGLAPGAPLTDILFENVLPANNNFYFTPKGIGFVYDPYEVASYAEGQINVFIPFEALSAYLNPGFIQRMGIDL